MKYVRFERMGVERYGTWEDDRVEVRQLSNARELVFSPQEILSYCSRYFTLLPGDVIFTGTPGKTQRVERGDTIEVTLEGVGTLRNTVAGMSR